MTLHICKDFLSIPPHDAGFATAYFGAIFLRGVLGFTQVGHTSFNLDSGSITKASGTNAAINLGTTLERAVSIPSGTYVLSISDLDRILTLKSTTAPLFNSGLFRIVGVDTTNNRVYVNSRLADLPKAETGLAWKIFENEITVVAGFSRSPSTPSTGNTYHGAGNSTASRIILQSPHSTVYQVRIACESSTDTNAGSAGTRIGAKTSFIPGFDGNSSGDFLNGGHHLHMPLWWNKVNVSGIDASAERVNSTVPGYQGAANTNTGLRYYMWGDDVTGTIAMIVREHGTSSTTLQGLFMCGIPENEEIYSPSLDIHRLFAFGNSDSATDSTVPITIAPGVSGGDGMMGVAFGLSNQPVTCIPSSYCFLAGNASGASIMHNVQATDNVYSLATELYSYDLLVGTWDAAKGTSQVPGLILEGRRMGTLPFARRGRTNFNTWSTSPDGLWLHTENGVYLPWSGSFLP